MKNVGFRRRGRPAVRSPAIRGGLPLRPCIVHAGQEKPVSVVQIMGIVQVKEAQQGLGRPVRSNPYFTANKAMKAVALFLPITAAMVLARK